MEQSNATDLRGKGSSPRVYLESTHVSAAAEPNVTYSSMQEMDEQIKRLKKAIDKAAKELDFIEAARLKNELIALQKVAEARKGN